eukprot:TRINITY_DN4483_c0_g1_i1.p1 TRINITY_DN4483_c0_g1~~TRINITY_DN4483_c0_g1_i1.p1  ORF type:complete len:489 (-),score=75.91 TRINITY_DN4483_c0_g1_i1:159-1625(-)
MSGRGRRGKKTKRERVSVKSNPIGRGNNNHRKNNRGDRRRNTNGDNDGDVSMKSTTVQNYNKRVVNTKEIYESEGKFRISIGRVPIGLDPNTVLEQIKKQGITLTPSEMSLSKNNNLIITITDPIAAQGLVRLNQIRIRNTLLKIESIRDKSDRGGQMSYKELETLFLSKYSPETQCLDLSNLDKEKCNFNQVGPKKSLAKFIEEKCKDVKSLSLASNGISKLQGFRLIMRQAQSLANLSLEGNELSNFKELDNLRPMTLELLMLSSNPFCEDNATYVSEIQNRFPKLKYLDLKELSSTTLETPISTTTTTTTTIPLEVPKYIESGMEEGLVTGFVTRFLEAFDKNREKLMEVYSPQATFSLTCEDPQYVTLSRNLIKVNDDAQRMNLLKIGNIVIAQLIWALPPTIHKLESLSVEAAMLPAFLPTNNHVLSINLHGFILEVGTNVVREFDRVMLLSPATPNSTAANGGWFGQIENDMLHLGTAMPFQ